MSTTMINSVPVNIRADIFKQIDGIAKQQNIRSELLVNKILEQYIYAQTISHQSSNAAFLLSIKGMFDSGENTTSEHVKELVKESVGDKYAK